MKTKKEYVVMAKPVGSRCNMACRYCYYLGKGQLPSPGVSEKHKLPEMHKAHEIHETLEAHETHEVHETHDVHEPHAVMSRAVLESMIKQLIASSPVPTVSIVWHGGEPTLAGLDFYREVMAIEKKYLPQGWQIWNNLQTNGLLIDEAWCDFLRENRWDVGVSIDGTKAAHDAYRHFPESTRGVLASGSMISSRIGTARSGSSAAPAKNNASSAWERTAGSIRMLKAAGVPVDLLCTVNAETAQDPEGVYDTLKGFDTGWMQFIPVVVRQNGLSAESVTPAQYGDFLCRVFDRWLSCRDVGRVHIQLFDETARVWRGGKPSLCWMQETCGRALIVEKDGSVYSCDHFVDPQHRLGDIRETDLGGLAASPAQLAFGQSKHDALCDECRACRWLSVCGGGCPKDRIATDGGQPKYLLCEGLKMFFEHAHAAMRR